MCVQLSPCPKVPMLQPNMMLLRTSTFRSQLVHEGGALMGLVASLKRHNSHRHLSLFRATISLSLELSIWCVWIHPIKTDCGYIWEGLSDDWWGAGGRMCLPLKVALYLGLWNQAAHKLLVLCKPSSESTSSNFQSFCLELLFWFTSLMNCDAEV